MIIKVDSSTYFVFDLDDTLYNEIDYLKSAYYAISCEMSPDQCDILYNEMIKIYLSGGNSFQFLMEKYPAKNLSIEKLLNLYRNHFPEISLRDGVLDLLDKIKKRKAGIGIITDGRSITQRNKIKALGIEHLVDKLVISEEFGFEKPTPALFESFLEKNIGKQFYFFGDNVNKDFITPKKLAWCCIGIMDKKNIRYKNSLTTSIEHLPHIFVNNFSEIKII